MMKAVKRLFSATVLLVSRDARQALVKQVICLSDVNYTLVTQLRIINEAWLYNSSNQGYFQFTIHLKND